MAISKLSLDIPDTLNLCVLPVIDRSIYNPDIEITCPLLQITVPGFTNPQFVDDVEPNFFLNLTACQLKVQANNCGTVFNDLPDGVYIIKWSISPNEYVYVEYNHLRITKALTKIKKMYCDLDMGACQPAEGVEVKLRQLRGLQDMLMAAQAKVAYCRESSKGLELYKYATAKLDRLKCSKC